MLKKTPFILVPILMMAVVVYSLSKLPHQFSDNECGICHDLAGKPGAASVKNSLTNSCLQCHTTLFDEGYMHPVDMTPKKTRIPADFPLSASGTMTCATCHDIHADYESPFGGHSKFLRRYEKGKKFCDICHMDSLSISDGHNSVFRKAHMGAKFTETSDSMQIDSMSRDCISCHDGSIGPSVVLNAGTWQHTSDFMAFEKGGMHPIGMGYSSARSARRKAMLRPRNSVDKRIRFFNGDAIGCGSCHDPYSTLPKKLIMKNEHSSLCFACHKMDKR